MPAASVVPAESPRTPVEAEPGKDAAPGVTAAERRHRGVQGGRTLADVWASERLDDYPGGSPVYLPGDPRLKD